jgi:hypothetical protein
MVLDDVGDRHSDLNRFRRIALLLPNYGCAPFPCYGVRCLRLPDTAVDCTCPPYHSQRRQPDGTFGRCNSPGKHPATPNGVLDATLKFDQIRDWWTTDPTYNPAIACGLSFLIVIDVDQHGPDDGMATWKAICVAIGLDPEPDTWIVLTGGGGMHVYFRVPAAYRDRPAAIQFRKTLGPGVDVQAGNKYVLAATAEHASGRAYICAIGKSFTDLPIMECPAALWDLIVKPETPYVPGGTRGAIADSLLGELFERRGLVLASFADKWCVTCPWQDEHTTGNSLSGTVLFPPIVPGGLGGLCCQHAHCAERGSEAALKMFSPEEIAAARVALTARGVPDPWLSTGRSKTPPPIDGDGPAREATMAGPDLAAHADGPDRPDDPPPTSPPNHQGNGNIPPPDFSPYRNGDGTPLPWLNVGNGDLEGQTTDLTRELGTLRDAAGQPTVYQRGTDLVRVRADPGTAAHIQVYSSHALRGEAARVAAFFHWVKVPRDGTVSPDFERLIEDDFYRRRVDPPKALVEVVLAARHWSTDPVSPLEHVSELPPVRPGTFSIATSPGYDNETWVYYAPPPDCHLPTLPEHPTADELAAAVAYLDTLLSDFPFDPAHNSAGRANTYAMLLTPVLRSAIQGCVPLCLIDKPDRGTGASYLAKLARLIAHGNSTVTGAAKKSDEEWEKWLLAIFLRGELVTIFDDFGGDLTGTALAAALTDRAYAARLLGESRMVTTLNHTLFIVTGKNITVGDDIVRRYFWIRLAPLSAAQRKSRRFRFPDLHGKIRTERARVLAALLTLVRAWTAAGAPHGRERFASYDDWAGTIGGILAHAGIPGFLSNQDQVEHRPGADDAIGAAFFAQWFTVFPDTPLTASQLADALAPGDSFRQIPPGALHAIPAPEPLARATTRKFGESDGSYFRRLGMALARLDGRSFGNYRLVVNYEAHTKINTYSVVMIDREPGEEG